MVAILGYTKKQIFEAVKAMYTAVATRPDTGFHFPIGREACGKVGYPAELLDGVPAAALESFAGVGCPFRANAIRAGDTVLDIGSGSGTDVMIASRLVGPRGRVFALDMTPAMLDKLEHNRDAAGIENVTTLSGQAEDIPLPDASVDVVTSNGVLNLVPDKRKAVAEIFRVLRPGGRVQIADIVIGSPVTPDCEDDPQLWAECVVGATVDEEYLNLFRDAGFNELAVLRSYDYFSFSPSAETRAVAERFGARAVELSMRRGVKAPSRIVQLARRTSPRRLLAAAQRRGLWGFIALALAVIACYGTLLVTGLLSMVGIGLAVDEGAWASFIVLFALLAVATIALGLRRHHAAGPLIISGLGAGAIAYAMFGAYSLALELAGFALLAIGTYWDFRLRRAHVMRRAFADTG